MPFAQLKDQKHNEILGKISTANIRFNTMPSAKLPLKTPAKLNWIFKVKLGRSQVFGRLPETLETILHQNENQEAIRKQFETLSLKKTQRHSAVASKSDQPELRAQS